MQALDRYADELRALKGGHFMLFNTRFFQSDPYDVQAFVNHARKLVPHAEYSALIDPRIDDAAAYVDRAYEMGAKGVKFHSYHQQLDRGIFNAVLSIARMAEDRGMMVELDTSYGTTKMYAHDNLKLACLIADHITKVPIILLHSGGARVLEAMLLAAEKKNVYLESSFSLVYYQESSVQRDMAFAFRKIGIDRVLYGSDHPYVRMGDSMMAHRKFFEDFCFSPSEVNAVMYDNAMRLFA